MIRKFALLATTAALMVACGGSTDENTGTVNAMADSAAKMMNKAAEDMKASAATMADTAAKVMNNAADSATKVMNAAADKVKAEADKKMGK